MEEAIEKLETLKPNKKPYGIGLDVVRIIAMFLVLMVHSTTTYGFVEEGVNSFVSVLVGAGRYLSYSCVAIFIILTGYLYCNKKPTVKYYVKLVKILIEFFLCAIIIAIFNKLYLGSKTDLSTILYRMFMFSFPDFSWYIRMYIGLFLIAPFKLYYSRANR